MHWSAHSSASCPLVARAKAQLTAVGPSENAWLLRKVPALAAPCSPNHRRFRSEVCEKDPVSVLRMSASVRTPPETMDIG